MRGAITGGGTFLGGILHTLPFLIPHYHAALFFAIAVVAPSSSTLAYLRWRFFERHASFAPSASSRSPA